jgi:hypothetical protein
VTQSHGSSSTEATSSAKAILADRGRLSEGGTDSRVAEEAGARTRILHKYERPSSAEDGRFFVQIFRHCRVRIQMGWK